MPRRMKISTAASRMRALVSVAGLRSRFTTWSAQQCPCPITILDFLSVSEISRHVFPPPYGQRPMTHGISEAANRRLHPARSLPLATVQKLARYRLGYTKFVAQGGWEQPKFLSEEMRAGFRSLRK